MTNFVSPPPHGDAARRIADDIVACLLANEPRSVRPNASAKDVLARAERLAVGPRVASRLEPDPYVTERNAEANARAALRVHGAREVGAVLDRAGIQALLMKGAALAALGVGAELGDRHSDDVDVLVPEGHRSAAEAALGRAGYVRADAVTRPAVDGRPVAAQEVRAGDHAAPCLVSPTGVHVDLHDRVPDARLGTFAAFDGYTQQTADAATIPTPAALLAQLCDHVVVHHQARPSYLARHVADLVSLEARFGDAIWTAARPLCFPVAWQVSRALLWLARTNPSAAAGVLVPSERSRVAVEMAWEALDVAGRVRRDLFNDPSRLARKLVPARSYVAASYDVAPDDPRLPLLYVHRLVTFRWLTRPFYG